MYGVCELYFHAKGKFDRSQHAPLTSRNQKTTEKNNSSACYRFTQHRILRISDHVCNQTVSLILRLSPMIFFPAAGSSSRILRHPFPRLHISVAFHWISSADWAGGNCKE
mmetsp:Transcript_35425/g.110792  ORF Transcript_35425/g.110792 Transcript_35425/m.110792 type:complete len:110 (+) Transcript_35425:138-467(+)